MTIPFLDLTALHAPIAADLDRAWRRTVDSAGFIGGGSVDAFEEQWASFCGTKYCVGVSDGTAALELALRGLGVGPGDDVIVPVNTFIATWEAVIAAGANPIPVDVDPLTLLMTADGVERACTPRTVAVIAVHLYGQLVDMDALNSAAKRLGILVIEDAAQAHGASHHGQRAGSFGHVGCFSFYPGKNLGAFGDAGAVVTDLPDVAHRIRSIANHGRDPNNAGRHVCIGNNRRLDALQAAILSVKLPHLERWNAARAHAAVRYKQALAGLPLEIVTANAGSNHLFVIQVDDRDSVRAELSNDGVGTGIHYAIPCHLQPAYLKYAELSFPVAEKAAHRILSLPMSPTLSDVQVECVADALQGAIEKTSIALPRIPRAGPQLELVESVPRHGT